MCGIAGYFGNNGGKDALERMASHMEHRGPDEKGFYISASGGIATCRLAIIDLENGTQPMKSSDGLVSISFNGEIYNYRELKNELLRRGRIFKTDSDTEAILQGYEEWGTGIFEKLEGMFGIAILDEKRKQMFLARDLLGKKPLYWFRNSSGIIFASELKSLIAHPGIPREIDTDSLSSFLLFDGVPTPRCILKNVRKLSPGSMLSIHEKGVEEVLFRKFTPPSGCGNEEQYFDKVFGDAVRKRLLLADVPVGIFLSGGLDSSTVAWYASSASPRQLKTFSIGFDDLTYDESRLARIMAYTIGSEHHDIKVKEDDVLDVIPNLGQLTDEPIADPSILPTFILAREAKKHVTVALSGDGADELLMGYQTFFAARAADIIERIPGMSSFIRFASNFFPASDRYMSIGFAAKRFARGLSKDLIARDMLWRGSFEPEYAEKILIRGNPGLVFESEIEKWNAQIRGMNRFDGLALLYLRQYLMDVVLVKADRASMFASLELRSPFLDVHVANFLLSLPPKKKLGLVSGKKFLKKIMAPRLPKEILKQKKHGFALPVAAWFRGKLKEALGDILSFKNLNEGGVFNAREVVSMRDAHISGKADYRKELWAVFIFELWRKSIFKG